MGDVGMRGDVMGQVAGAVFHRGNRKQLRINFAGLAPVPDLAAPRSGFGNRGPHRLVKLRPLPARFQQTGVFAYHFGILVTGNGRERPIDPQDVAVGIGHDHALLRFEGHRGDAQFGVRLLALRNISGRIEQHQFPSNSSG